MSILMKTANLRKFSKLKLLAAIFIACVLGHAGIALAVSIDPNKLPGVMIYPVDKAFQENTNILKESSPQGGPLMAYEIHLPKGWSENAEGEAAEPAQSKLKNLRKKDGAAFPVSQQPAISDTVLSFLGRYTAPPRNFARSYVVVEGQGLSYEISAMHWFVNFVLSNGFSLTAVTEDSHKEVDGIYVQIEKDQTYVVRARVIINGNRLIMLRYYLPQENYEEEQAEQGMVVSSFKLSQPSEQMIERQETYGFLDQSFFNYPASWTLKEKSILSIERMHALLFQSTSQNEKLILDGHIKINVISRLLKTTLSQEIAAFRKNLVIEDYSVGNLIETIKFNYDPSVKYGKAQIYKLVPDDPVNMKDYEFFATIMQGSDYYYIVSMISPSREQDFFTWARNMEAYSIINQSIRRRKTTVTNVAPDPYYDYLKEYQDGSSTESPANVPLTPPKPASLVPNKQ